VLKNSEPSPIFAGKARSSTKGKLLASLLNIRLGSKYWSSANALAYYIQLILLFLQTLFKVKRFFVFFSIKDPENIRMENFMKRYGP
jgi:hypothetical protein